MTKWAAVVAIFLAGVFAVGVIIHHGRQDEGKTINWFESEIEIDRDEPPEPVFNWRDILKCRKVVHG